MPQGAQAFMNSVLMDVLRGDWAFKVVAKRLKYIQKINKFEPTITNAERAQLF